MASAIDPTLGGKLNVVGETVPRDELRTALTAAADEISALQADTTDVDVLETRIATAETSIAANATAITTKTPLNDGLVIREADPIMDAAKQFAAGGTFSVVPTNAKHYRIKVGDTATALTANMIVALDASQAWVKGAEVDIIKGDTSAFTVTVSGFDDDGLGTYTLARSRDSITAVYQSSETDSGPGAGGEKFERGPQGRINPAALDTSFDNTVSGASATTVQAAIDEQATIVQTAAEWTADTTTILGLRQTGRESDTGQEKSGNGVDLWGDLPYKGTIGGGHDPVTIDNTPPVTLTGDTTLIASHCTFGMSGQALWHDRFVFVDPAAATVLTLSETLAVGKQVDLQVIDVDYPVTIARPAVAEVGTGTTNGTDTVTMADTSMVRVGDAVSGTSITSGQTVLSITTDTSITLSAVADGSQADDDLTFAGKRGVFNGSEADVNCAAGLVIVKVIGAQVGIDAEILGATTEGFGPINLVTEAADFSLSSAHFGKRTRCTKASGTQTITVAKPSVLGADVGVRCELKATLAGATTFTIAGTGSPTFVDVAADSLNITPGGAVVLTVADGDTWDVEGHMAPV